MVPFIIVAKDLLEIIEEGNLDETHRRRPIEGSGGNALCLSLYANDPQFRYGPLVVVNGRINLCNSRITDIMEVVEEVLRDENAEVLDPEVPGAEAEVPKAEQQEVDPLAVQQQVADPQLQPVYLFIHLFN